MKTLEEIKNKFAKNNTYNNWSEFMMLNSRNSILIEKAMDEIITLVQKEQQKIQSIKELEEDIKSIMPLKIQTTFPPFIFKKCYK